MHNIPFIDGHSWLIIGHAIVGQSWMKLVTCAVSIIYSPNIILIPIYNTDNTMKEAPEIDRLVTAWHINYVSFDHSMEEILCIKLQIDSLSRRTNLSSACLCIHKQWIQFKCYQVFSSCGSCPNQFQSFWMYILWFKLCVKVEICIQLPTFISVYIWYKCYAYK
jgi:hypothetical protein